jgi:[ribosomal protein S5]-alanine N-acetyltransferase
MNVPKQILETPRLILREMSLDDLDFVAVMLADPEVMRYYPKCYSRQEAQTWIERQAKRYARHGHGLWLVLDKATAQPVGQVGLVIQQLRGVEEKEVGYLIHRPFWRRGFATEAASACRDYAFDILGRQRVLALIRPENLTSRAVARKLGMQPEADLIEHSRFEHMVFSIARDAGKSAWNGLSLRPLG